MTTHIALLRAINVGGQKTVAMSDLKQMAVDMGLLNVRTLLATGNLVFDSKVTGPDLEEMLEKEAKSSLGLDTDFLVRTATQWKSIVANNPFPKQAKADPARLVLMVCREPVKSLEITGSVRELVRARGKEIYIVYPDGIGRSKLKLSARGTGRNWNTVLKIRSLLR